MSVTPSVAAALLAYAAATDNREITEEAARAWAAALHHTVTLADGKAAIDAHRADSTDWLMPAHVNHAVRAIRRGRLEHVNPEHEVPPDELRDSPTRAKAWLVEYRSARGDGEDHDVALDRACSAVGIDIPPELPPGDPEKVRQLVAQVAEQIPSPRAEDAS